MEESKDGTDKLGPRMILISVELRKSGPIRERCAVSGNQRNMNSVREIKASTIKTKWTVWYE